MFRLKYYTNLGLYASRYHCVANQWFKHSNGWQSIWCAFTDRSDENTNESPPNPCYPNRFVLLGQAKQTAQRLLYTLNDFISFGLLNNALCVFQICLSPLFRFVFVFSQQSYVSVYPLFACIFLCVLPGVVFIFGVSEYIHNGPVAEAKRRCWQHYC